MMELFSYFRSSTAYRARIALNLKGLEYKITPVNILKGEQHAPAYRAKNAMGGVPLLHDGPVAVAQSLAIIDYLDAIQSDPPLVFGSAAEQAYARQIALTIGCDIHPLTNLRVTTYLRTNFAADDAAIRAWVLEWVPPGVRTVETLLREGRRTGRFALGDQPGLADLCIVPQLYGLRRFSIPVDEFPLCRMIESNALHLPAFQNAAPELQPDAPDGLAPIHGPGFHQRTSQEQ